MARPIEVTPTLRGEDARRFLQRMEEAREIPKEEMEQMMKDYASIEWVEERR